MLHTDSARARRSETPVRRNERLTSARSHFPSEAEASDDATFARAGGPTSHDFDVLDWLRFWLPESDWHVRQTAADRRTAWNVRSGGPAAPPGAPSR